MATLTRRVLARDALTFTRYAAVGFASNLLLYLLYLALTAAAGLQPVSAATIGWAVSVVFSFLLNRSWTFGYTGPRNATFVRYTFLYAAAYLLNIVSLVLLVDQAGLPHELAQGALIILCGLGLFIGQRYWVFRSDDDR